jgi:hypothetical protein
MQARVKERSGLGAKGYKPGAGAMGRPRLCADLQTPPTMQLRHALLAEAGHTDTVWQAGSFTIRREGGGLVLREWQREQGLCDKWHYQGGIR